MQAHVCRHYSDAVLVAVIALCTLENDVIHAGYLALALYFFRQRESLRTPALFRWLPLYNFGVMLLSLAYQAPLQNLWHGTPHRQVMRVVIFEPILNGPGETCCFAFWTAVVTTCKTLVLRCSRLHWKREDNISTLRPCLLPVTQKLFQ